MPMQKSRPRILMVDDEKILLDIFEELLMNEGFDVIKTDRGEDALEIIRAAPPDVVMLDLNMPEMGGLEILDQIREELPEMPVVIVSGAGDIRSVIEALRRGAWDFLLKPIRETDILVHAINRALERGRLIRENQRYQEHLEALVTQRTSELSRRGDILKALSFAAQRFLKARDIREPLPEILETLGKAVNRGHIFIMSADDSLWSIWPPEPEPADGETSPELEKIYRSVFMSPRQRQVLENGDIIVGDAEAFSPEDRETLKTAGVCSLLAAPVFVNGRWWGLTGFDNTHSADTWSVYEAEAVKTAANTLGMAAERLNKEEQLKLSLDEKEVLLKEIHHRVKNNMAVMSGLLSLQARSEKDARLEAAFRESSARIRSMALVHEKLYQSHNLSNIDFAQYIDSLVRHLTGMYRRSENIIAVNVHAEPIQVNIMKAIPCGLILNELFTNSLKYAFPADASGEINVIFRKQTDTQHLELIVSDNGSGIPETVDIASPNTLGLQLVHMLSRQLGGELRLERREGTYFQLRFPDDKTI